MFKLLKWLFYLGVLAFLALVSYAYVGPFFGADFSPPATETQQDIILEKN